MRCVCACLIHGLAALGCVCVCASHSLRAAKKTCHPSKVTKTHLAACVLCVRAHSFLPYFSPFPSLPPFRCGGERRREEASQFHSLTGRKVAAWHLCLLLLAFPLSLLMSPPCPSLADTKMHVCAFIMLFVYVNVCMSMPSSSHMVWLWILWHLNQPPLEKAFAPSFH